LIRLLLLFLLTTTLFANTIERNRWKNGETYLNFLENNNLPMKELYYNLDKDDQRLTEEMRAGIHYQVSRNEDGSIDQILLALNDELQIHIYKQNSSYKFEAIPIISVTKEEGFSTKIVSSPAYTIIKETGSKKLAQIFVTSFQHSLNFKNDIRKGDNLVMIYDQKYRLGEAFSMPVLKVAMIEMRHKKHYIYLNSDERYYDEKARRVEGFLLARPVRGARISSRFTKRRWHPILHKWKAHLGVDFAARRGTPVMAAGSGTIVWSQRMGSYGNLVKIRHSDGYETRYAHLKAFRRGIHRGKHVKKGQVIGYVGTTGRSTGPHLHFELRKHGRAINPLRVVQITTKKLSGKAKKSFLKLQKKYNKMVQTQIENSTPYKKQTKLQTVCYLHHNTEPTHE